MRSLFPHDRPVLLLAALTLALTGLGLRSMRVQAVPALPVDITLTQPDGATFQARAWGNEWLHGYETPDGYTVIQDEDSGYWVYAQPEGNRLVPARVGGALQVAGKDAPPAPSLHARPEFTGPAQPALLAQAAPLEPAAVSNGGSQPVLVLLVSFSDQPGTYTPADFHNSFFGAANSVRAYYQQASFGRLSLDPAAESSGAANDGVVGWINLGYPHPNPGSVPNTSVYKLVNDALAEANPYVNYASFDRDRNGQLSNDELHLVIVVAGYERAVSSLKTPNIWAHRDSLNSPISFQLDGTSIAQAAGGGGYTLFGEIHAVDSTHIHQATIGVMVHELGHDLAWPDLYDINQINAGVGNWSIMGGGSWNTDNSADRLFGNSPAMPDAFLKYYQGWINPMRARDGQTITLGAAESSPTALMLGHNPGGVDWQFRLRSGAGEYWLVEYRARTGYDSGLPGCGLLVWHVNETVRADNYANAYASPYRPLIELEQADGLFELRNSPTSRGNAGDPYPGTSGNRRFDEASTPGSRLYSGAASGWGFDLLNDTCAASMSIRVASIWEPTFLPVIAR